MKGIHIRKEQQDYFCAFLKVKPVRFGLRVKHMDQAHFACDLDIVSGNNVLKIDSLGPVVDLSEFPLPLEVSGPHTRHHLLALKKEALRLWLGTSEFLLSDVDVRNFPNIRISLSPAAGVLPKGVDLRAFVETSAAEVLKDTDGCEGYFALGRPLSKRNVHYFKRA